MRPIHSLRRIGIILAFIFSCTFSFGQTENFLVNNGQMQWQKVYEKSIEINEVSNVMNKNGMFYDVGVTENTINFKFKDYKIDYKSSGKSLMSIPSYISNGQYAGNGYIDIKEGKYRVTINHLTYLFTTLNLSGNNMNQTSFILEDGTVKKGTNDFTSRFKKDAYLFNNSFNNLFDFSRYNQVSDDF